MIPKPKRIRDAKYLAWIRTRPCIALNCVEGPPSEPHHVKPKGGGIMGSKVSDRRTVPVCRKHHEAAERSADSWRNYFESSIPVLNQVYDATYPVAPRKTRTLQPVAKLRIEHCVCGRSHTIKFSIAERVLHPFQGYDYKCPETNKDASARLA